MKIADIVKDTKIPKMALIEQCFPADELVDVKARLCQELKAPAAKLIKPGMKIAIGVGSRGIANLTLLVKTVVEKVKSLGAEPFIVPAMGSHGGATAEGQLEILKGLGITEAAMGCAFKATMEPIYLGKTQHGVDAYFDSNASGADGIIVLNRIKAHTGFSGAHESGLAKMLAVGFGKQKGASALHGAGRADMARNIGEVAAVSLAKLPVLLGIAIVENAYDKTKIIKVVTKENILAADQDLLLIAKKSMAAILPQPVDVLIVDALGKEFSGAGMDSHVTGRASWPFVKVGPEPGRITALDLTEKSHGNATGVGCTDVIPQKLFNKINFEISYTNALTAGGTQSVRVPMVVANDELAIKVAIHTRYERDWQKMKVVRIPNTLQLRYIYVSENMLPLVAQDARLKIVKAAEPMQFDAQGNILPLEVKA